MVVSANEGFSACVGTIVKMKCPRKRRVGVESSLLDLMEKVYPASTIQTESNVFQILESMSMWWIERGSGLEGYAGKGH